MPTRRPFLLAALIAITLSVVAIAQSILPAQDGLKFIRVAKQFHSASWTSVVRGSDQHPLYPALIALVQPVTALVWGDGASSWRVAAQLVSIFSYLGLLWPLHRLATRLFRTEVADLCVFLFVLLPIPAELGRDTLSDALGLLCFTAAFSFASAALSDNAWRSWLGAGLCTGLGFLARPEILLLLVSVGLVVLINRRRDLWRFSEARTRVLQSFGRLAGFGLGALVLVGGYALVKGEVSEKLALRSSAALGPSIQVQNSKTVDRRMPAGLDKPGFDFSPKEETGKAPLKGKIGRVLGRIGHEWVEGIGWIFAPFALLGFVFCRRWEGSSLARRLVFVHMILFCLIATRHALSLGYLSGRHAMPLVVLSMPFVAAAMWHWAVGVPGRRNLSPANGRRLAILGLTGLFLLGTTVQTKAMHPSRKAHWQAGRWLAKNSQPGEAVLDTRGWAAFVRGGSTYDYWHVRQALTDPHLTYIVVEGEELEAKTPRARTLQAVLAYSCQRVAEFEEGDTNGDGEVLIFRFHRPKSWEGIAL